MALRVEEAMAVGVMAVGATEATTEEGAVVKVGSQMTHPTYPPSIATTGFAARAACNGEPFFTTACNEQFTHSSSRKRHLNVLRCAAVLPSHCHSAEMMVVELRHCE